ncbi:threonine/serine exporter family protein [Paenibacillus turpanensis]|uniref:threonine/serine exporter family protein n=1 Tax=Paenibacillus turpanensis TaxID=2689078 RepID=UPI00140BC5EC|nr:threonine/serine exporter family protein [Paenibacillus turpanensis]
MKNELRVNDIIEVSVLAGKIMLENGAETYRVEDTMERISRSFGAGPAHSYVTPTAILFSLEGAEKTRLARISSRTIRLDKVTWVNRISRQISAGQVTLPEAYRLLKEAEAAKQTHPLWYSTIVAGISSGCFMMMFNGMWSDFIPAAAAGGLGFLSLILLQKVLHIKFFAEFSASLFIGLLASLFVYVGAGTQYDKIVIGSVMPLVPGLLITNAVRDLMAGHLVSGLSKGAEAFLTAFAIGTGIAVVLSWFG